MDGLEAARRLIAGERERRTGFLDLGNLGLTEVPDEVLALTHLRSLNLGSWYVDDRGEVVRSANGSEESANALQALPPGLGTLAALHSLSFVGNPVCDLGPLSGLAGLQSLYCASTRVSDLAPLSGLTGLQSLGCSTTQISDLGPLSGLAGLQWLGCWDTQISDLGPLSGLAGLQWLYCSLTAVSDLGPLSGLTGLQSLECSSTQVSDLGPLSGLAGLQSLGCSATQISDLGPLSGLTGLQWLDCSRTQVSDLGPLKALTGLLSLDCSSTQVSDLRPLGGLTDLQSLSFRDTQISDLGPLSGLTGLLSLNCSLTLVSGLGPLSGLTGLQSLDCSLTVVSDLGPLSGLAALQSLYCSYTQVSDLGPLSGLAGLQSFGCWDTQVSDLGPLSGLTGLQSLDCSRTRVSDLGPLVALAALRTLRTIGCRLVDLPRRLVLSRSLSHLILHETTIPGIPPELLSPDDVTSCLDELREHLADLEAGTEEVRATKLVVLGNGRVGKTQICRRLRGLPYDDTVPSTHGITVSTEPWPGAAEGETLNIWDFGGQDIYHGAHTLFMKTSAVFLVVWHPDFEAMGEQTVDGLAFRNYPLPYWLEYVRRLGRKDCPVIVVQSRCDRPEQEVRRLPVEDAFLKLPSLKPCWYSARTRRGHGALEDALRDAIGTLRERDGIATIGRGRMRVLRQLEAWRDEDQALAPGERRHRTLSRAEFDNLCEQGGGVSSPGSLLAYLHNLGIVFHQPGLFHDRIILDQSWALEAVYGVFDRRKAYPLILGQRGRFTKSLLAMTAWRDYADAEHELFLSLMQSCGMAFVCRGADERLGLETEYLAPDMLPGREAVADQLAGRWTDDAPVRRLEYRYPFLHPGLMRAVLCDVGRVSADAGVYWKAGMWVYEKDTGCRAIIEQEMADERRGRIVVRAQGDRHERVLDWLCERIEERSRLFGYPDIAPAPDEATDTAPARGIRVVGRSRTGGLGGSAAAAAAGRGAPEEGLRPAEPSFAKPPPSFFPAREAQVFVSYAWGDETDEGRRRGRLVDDLCRELGRQGIGVRRDRDEMRPGELISEFMDRLAEGDLILAVISDKYLRSEYCMYELFRIYRNCADRPERFLRRVVPLILPDARVTSALDRLGRAIYWMQQEQELKPLVEAHVDAVGTEFFRKFKLIGEFARNSSNMLEYLVDKLQPRDFDRQAAEGFREVVAQIRSGR